MSSANIPMTQLHVSSKSREFMTVDLNVREHKFTIDEPVEMGGEDLGITPIEAGLAGLNSCTSIIIRVLAKKMGLSLQSVDVQAFADFDLRGVMFKEEVDQPYKKITLMIKLTGELDTDQLHKLGRDIRAFCPMYKLFTQAGTEIIESWQILPE